MGKYHIHTFTAVIPLAIAFIISLTYLSQFNLFYFLGLVSCWILIGGYGLELGLHRYFSHNSFQCHPIIEWSLALLGSLSLNGSPIFWKAVHVTHHRNTDSQLDPHSPIHGIFESYIGWIIKKSSINAIKVTYAGKKLLTSRFHKFLHKHYYKIILCIFLTVYLVNPLFFWLSFIPAVFVSFNQGPIVNYFCHNDKFGYINFNLDNKSKNIKFLSFFTFGLALHNNHHKYPGQINFAINHGEIDLGFYLSKLVCKKLKS